MDILEEQGITQIKWTRAQADRACGPLVYIFWAVADGARTALYVGRSAYGLMRPLDTKHAQARAARLEADQLEFLCCQNIQQAERLEKKLIYNLQPTLNQVGKIAKTPRNVEARQAIDFYLSPEELKALNEIPPAVQITEQRKRMSLRQIRKAIEQQAIREMGYRRR